MRVLNIISSTIGAKMHARTKSLIGLFCESSVSVVSSYPSALSSGIQMLNTPMVIKKRIYKPHILKKALKRKRVFWLEVI
jgi:hypothetical protein